MAKNTKVSAKELQEIAKKITGKENPDIPEIDPDKLRQEETSPAGLVLPSGSLQHLKPQSEKE